MKNRINFIIPIAIACLFFQSCVNFETADNDTILMVKKLAELSTENAALQRQIDSLESAKPVRVKPYMSHIILFDIKEDMSDKQLVFLISEIKKLDQIPVVKNLEVGKFKDMGDERSIKNRELIVSMDFNSEADFYSYQNDARHFELKNIASPFLENKPMTFDYISN